MGRIKNLSLRKYFFLITIVYLLVALLLSVLCYNLCDKAIDEFGLYRSMDYESAKEYLESIGGGASMPSDLDIGVLTSNNYTCRNMSNSYSTIGRVYMLSTSTTTTINIDF